ncbi:MAG: Asp23/Gls24 family envelope stress response protein [Eubacteriales bacterium]|nr:Asp23/Gls24 family envelope stress response protein [Eubacteriales bacterium]NLF46718.1 Asp23/Gls24 family envelope stress response protein [Clostridiales bacterium]
MIDNFEPIHDEDLGSVKISDEVMAICAINATLRTEGVAELAGGVSDVIAESILGKESLSKGVKVSQNEDGIIFDVYIIVEYGVKIPTVAWDIQSNVKNEVETMTDREVLGVNIHVQGVEEESEKNEKI